MEHDPASLYHDTDLAEACLIAQDPLEITPEMELMAEQPELADPVIGLIRERPARWRTAVHGPRPPAFLLPGGQEGRRWAQ
jgi:hypothetical protein